MKTLIRQLLEEQSDLGLHCLPRPICPKNLDHYGTPTLTAGLLCLITITFTSILNVGTVSWNSELVFLKQVDFFFCKKVGRYRIISLYWLILSAKNFCLDIRSCKFSNFYKDLTGINTIIEVGTCCIGL